MNDEWIRLLGGEVSPEDAGPLLSGGAADLHAFLEAHPLAGQELLEIFGRRLGGEINANTSEALFTSLVNYLGQGLAYLVVWVASADQASRLEELAKYASPQVMAILHPISGLYGQELQSAHAKLGELPDDWRYISREVYLEQISQRYLLRVRILKNNDEELVIEGPPDSILELTSNMIRTVGAVNNADAFSKRTVEVFRDEVGQFARLFAEEKESVPKPSPKSRGRRK